MYLTVEVAQTRSVLLVSVRLRLWTYISHDTCIVLCCLFC